MNVVDIINNAVEQRRTRFAFELLPPLKGDGMGGVFESIDRLIGFDPAYINVTFHREGIKQAVRPDGSVEWHVVRRRPGTVGISAAMLMAIVASKTGKPLNQLRFISIREIKD